MSLRFTSVGGGVSCEYVLRSVCLSWDVGTGFEVCGGEKWLYLRLGSTGVLAQLGGKDSSLNSMQQCTSMRGGKQQKQAVGDIEERPVHTLPPQSVSNLSKGVSAIGDGRMLAKSTR